MSFGFTMSGSVAAVKHACDQTQQHESQHSIEAKKAIKAVLDGAGGGSTVYVEANGHHSYESTPGRSYANFDLKIRVQPTLPEPPQ